MKILITGIHGFVGLHLARLLSESSNTVIGLGTDSSLNSVLSNFVDTYIQCDLTRSEDVARIPFENIDAIINLAGLAAVGPSFDNPDLYMRVNTAVIDTLCDAILSRNTAIRILAISSGAVYGSSQSMPLSETSNTDTSSSPYAASKIAMEQQALTYRDQGIDCVIVRPFNHIGPGQAAGFLLPDIAANVNETLAKNLQELRVGNLETQRDYTDVRDVAAAYVALCTAPRLTSAVYNVCSGNPLAGTEILNHVLKAKTAEHLSIVVDKAKFRPSDSPVLYGDNSLIIKETEWLPTIPIEQTIADFLRAS